MTDTQYNPALNVLGRSKKDNKDSISIQEKEKRRLLSALQNTIDNNSKDLGKDVEAYQALLDELIQSSKDVETINIKRVLQLTESLRSKLGEDTENITKILDVVNTQQETEIALLIKETQSRLASNSGNLSLYNRIKSGTGLDNLSEEDTGILDKAKSDKEIERTALLNVVSSLEGSLSDKEAVLKLDDMTEALSAIRTQLETNNNLSEEELKTSISLLDSSEATISAIKTSDKDSISEQIKDKRAEDILSNGLSNITDKLDNIKLSSSVMSALGQQAEAESIGETATTSGIDFAKKKYRDRKSKNSRNKKPRKGGGLLRKGGGLLRKGGGLLRKGGGKGRGGKLGSLMSKASLLSGAATGGIGKFGSLISGAGKLASKAALPLALATSMYEGFQGYNNADELLGLQRGQEATTGEKLSAAGGSIVSGLTLGLVDAGDASKAINSTTASLTSGFKPDIINDLENRGIVSTSILGDSEIRDPAALKSMTMRELQALQDYDDWSDEDKNFINSMVDAKKQAVDMKNSGVPDDIIKMTTGETGEEPQSSTNSTVGNLANDIPDPTEIGNKGKEATETTTQTIVDNKTSTTNYISNASIYDPSFLNFNS